MGSRTRTLAIGKTEWAIAAASVVLFASLALGDAPRVALSSAETRFVEHSASGLQIVPASCPSSPHDGGTCSGPYQCNLNFAPSVVAQGSNATLYWNAPVAGTLSYPGGSQNVAASGSMLVNGDQTKTYVLSYTSAGGSASRYDGGGGTPVSCSAILTVCPAGQVPRNGVCVPASQCTTQYFCQGNDLYLRNAQCQESFVQACSFGCSGGVCYVPNPQGNITVTPSLIERGATTEVSWTATEVQSCTVSENNPDISDSGSGANGSFTSSPIEMQTRYTLNCIGIDGSTITDSDTVNVIPVFEEQ